MSLAVLGLDLEGLGFELRLPYPIYVRYTRRRSAPRRRTQHVKSECSSSNQISASNDMMA
jgi:hypothetical protein